MRHSLGTFICVGLCVFVCVCAVGAFVEWRVSDDAGDVDSCCCAGICVVC